MKKKLAIAAALLLIAAVGAYFCLPVRLVPEEDAGGLHVTYIESLHAAVQVDYLTEQYSLEPGTPEYDETLELLQISRCRRTLGTLFGRDSADGAQSTMTITSGSGWMVMLTDAGEVLVNGRAYRCQAKPLIYAILDLARE